MLYNNPADGPVADPQGSPSWLGKWEGIFQSGNFQQIGKVRENHTKYWRSPGILDKHYSSFLVIFKLTYYYYLLQTKLWKGNVFTPVCQSFCSQWGGVHWKSRNHDPGFRLLQCTEFPLWRIVPTNGSAISACIPFMIWREFVAVQDRFCFSYCSLLTCQIYRYRVLTCCFYKIYINVHIMLTGNPAQFMVLDCDTGQEEK